MRLLPLLLAAALILPGHADGEQERARLEVLKEKIAELKDSLQQRHTKADKLNGELEKRERALADINRRIAELDGAIGELRRELSGLSERRGSLKAQQREQEAQIGRELNAAYRTGRAEPVKLLLNQEDPQKLARTLQYYRYFVEARRTKIDSYQKTLEELTAVEKSIVAKQTRLEESRRALASRKRELGEEQAKRQVVLEQLRQTLESDRARLANLGEKREQLEALIARLEKAIQNLAPSDSAEPFTKRKGQLPWPVGGTVAHAYGSERARSLKWTGWLINAESGNPVHAVHSGRVVFSDYLRGHGLMLIVDHGKGYLSLYAHNQVLLKDVGDWVRGGETVARVGNTGGLEDSALYFEIRHNGKPQDPGIWLSARR